MTRGEQAARWLAKQPNGVEYNKAARRFGVHASTVKRQWLRLGFKPRVFRGELAAQWLSKQSGEVGYEEAGQRFGLTKQAVQAAWLLLGLGETPRQRTCREQRERGEVAARWLSKQKDALSYADAARRFDVSPSVVAAAWKRLALGKTPRDKALSAKQAKRSHVLRLARSGKMVAEIMAAVDIPRWTICAWCSAAKVRLERRYGHRAVKNPEALAAGLKVVRRGGSITKGASVANLSRRGFSYHLKRKKIKPKPARRRALSGRKRKR